MGRCGLFGELGGDFGDWGCSGGTGMIIRGGGVSFPLSEVEGVIGGKTESSSSEGIRVSSALVIFVGSGVVRGCGEGRVVIVLEGMGGPVTLTESRGRFTANFPRFLCLFLGLLLLVFFLLNKSVVVDVTSTFSASVAVLLSLFVCEFVVFDVDGKDKSRGFVDDVCVGVGINLIIRAHFFKLSILCIFSPFVRLYGECSGLSLLISFNRPLQVVFSAE